MMIPQVAGRLMEKYGQNAKTVADPFIGSGTTLVEAKVHHSLETAYGIDINPLGRLMSKVKSTPLDTELLKRSLNGIVERYRVRIGSDETYFIPDAPNLGLWFKPRVIRSLSVLRECINDIDMYDAETAGDAKDFFLLAFSGIVRSVSNTRNSEFKLYRMTEADVAEHNPDVIAEFVMKAEYNIAGMREFGKVCNDCTVNILAEDMRYRTSIDPETADIVVTSPPYGDSRTTVAYGQFSRLSLEWLDLDTDENIRQLDARGLGGRKAGTGNEVPLETLHEILAKISSADEKRAAEVFSFYDDLFKCIKETDRIMKHGAPVCFVVGNRTVKKMNIPTDEIIAELFEHLGHEHLETVIRNIPNKRMPSENSPANRAGDTSPTMTKEHIVILRKP